MRRSGLAGLSAAEQVHSDFAHRDAWLGVQRLENGRAMGLPSAVHMARMKAHHGKTTVRDGPTTGRARERCSQRRCWAGASGVHLLERRARRTQCGLRQMQRRRRGSGCRSRTKAMAQNYAPSSGVPTRVSPANALVALDGHGQQKGQPQNAGNAPDPTDRILEHDQEHHRDEDDRGQLIEKSQAD